MFPSSILPNHQLLVYQATFQIGSCFHLMFASKQPEPPCPLCGLAASRVHSHYTRFVADLPVAGYRVVLELQVRKFFCDKLGCPRWIFCERLPEVVKPYGRRSIRLAEALAHLGLLVSAEVSQRIADKFGIRTSPDSFLQLARGYEGASEEDKVGKVGIDDFAKRKGHSYGTMIVDLEQGCPIELLPDREVSTLKDWLETHPQIELITRDRASCYAEACTLGAPQAEQLADLWHLLKNLFEALEHHLAGEYKSLNAALKAAFEASETSETASPPPTPALPSQQASHLEPQALRRAWRQERFETVKRLHEQGWSKCKIAKTLGLHRVTVAKYLAAEELPAGNQGRRRASVLDAFKGYLQERHAQGCDNAAKLFRELRTRGYSGGLTILKDYLRSLGQVPLATSVSRAPAPAKLPSPKSLAWWLLSDPERLKPEQLTLVNALLSHLPDLKRAVELVREGWQLFRLRKQESLKTWIATVEATSFTELKRFVKGLESDFQAVQNALLYHWNNGVSEGNVNRLKMIKRTMFGRASFALLRAKVLYRP